MRKISDQTITGETIELKNSDDISYLGYDLKLVNCTLDIKASARNIVITQTEFLGCTIIAKKLSKFNWDRVKIDNCRFIGVFSENNFGDSRANGKHPTIIKNCDFSSAKLESTRFFDIDMETIKLPDGQHFSILNPTRFSLEKINFSLPGDIEHFVSYFETQSPRLVAYVSSLSETSKAYNIDIEDLKSVLERLKLVS
jgi:hypothetical protein